MSGVNLTAKRSSSKVNKKKPAKSGIPGEIKLLTGAAVAVILEISNFNILGRVGGWLRAFQFGLFGVMGYVFPVLIVAGIIFLEFSKKGPKAKFICSLCIYFFSGAIVHQLTSAAYEGEKLLSFYALGYKTSSGGGLLCGALSLGLEAAFGNIGIYIISCIVILACLLIIVQFVSLVKREKALPDQREKKNGKDKTRRRPVAEESVLVSQKGKGTARGSSVQEAQTPLPEGKGGMRSRYVQQSQNDSRRGKGGMRSRYKEQEVFRTQSNETVIRIVHTPESRKIKRAQTTRSANKAQTMRSTPASVRTREKVRGIPSDLDLKGKSKPADDLHEITNAALFTLKNETGKDKKPVIEVRDVTPGSQEKNQDRQKKAQAKPPGESAEDAAAEKKRPEGFVDPLAMSAASPASSLPPLSLLTKKKPSAAGSGEDTEKTSQNLEYVLAQFGVSAKVVNVQTGPAVTRYELAPEMGTKVSKFTSLADDLRLNLAVKEIRIEAPVPGKNVVGIELPNKHVRPVTLRELLESEALASCESPLAFAAGRSISGEVITGDIASMPHLLVAGTTGSGKSVFTKSIIMELLYRTRPEEAGLIVIDPKKVEFNVFEGIPNLMKSVVTDPGQAVSTLRWAVNEMMIRYERMNKNGVNNINSYNEKLARGLITDVQEDPSPMPRIVIVIDELADLMMVAKKEVESYICRLAQLSRAAGIHMIIATQRPSADVVTGLIKTNIPSRVALKVASGIDSRIILDTMGAEKLLGKGDMLFYPNGFSSPVRVQGAFVTDKEVADTVAYLRQQQSSSFYADKEKEIDNFINSDIKEQAGLKDEEKAPANHYDEFFHDAGLMCIEMGRASSSMLQRRFNLGFNRAARIIDQLCEFGVIGPANGSKPREILVDAMTFEEMYSELVK